MTIDDVVPAAVLTAVGRTLAGAPGAGEDLREMWDDAAPPWQRCLSAHYAADTLSDPAAALEWDLRALTAAQEIDRDVPTPVGFEPDAMLPSLHLNIAENYRLLGDNSAAAEHLAAGQAQLSRLDDTGYGGMIRAGLDRLAQRLASPAEPA